MSAFVKICGIRTQEALESALDNGADFIGFVFFALSPRYIDIPLAQKLYDMIPENVKIVGLFVDPSDEQLEDVLSCVRLDMLQLHGRETSKRTLEIKNRFNLPVIKAFAVGSSADIVRAHEYVDAADWYLFDAKAPEGFDVPGGNGQRFDWALLALEEFDRPWMLSGGLTPENVGEALSVLQPGAVDVSSGVEKMRGEKDPLKIKAFLEAVKRV